MRALFQPSSKHKDGRLKLHIGKSVQKFWVAKRTLLQHDASGLNRMAILFNAALSGTDYVYAVKRMQLPAIAAKLRALLSAPIENEEQLLSVLVNTRKALDCEPGGVPGFSTLWFHRDWMVHHALSGSCNGIAYGKMRSLMIGGRSF